MTKAAALLGEMPGRALKISFAISQTTGVTPQEDRIVRLMAQLDNKPERAFAALPEDRIAAILTAASDDLRMRSRMACTKPILTWERVLAGVLLCGYSTRIAAVDMAATAVNRRNRYGHYLHKMEMVQEVTLIPDHPDAAETIREEIEECAAEN